jgi:LPS sulfotransferase NodH
MRIDMEQPVTTSTPNIYERFFGPPPGTSAAANRLSEFDWREHDVDLSYVVFFTGRSGSTWLGRLLQDSGSCGAPLEFFNESFVQAIEPKIQEKSVSQYFSWIVKHYGTCGCFGAEIDAWRFEHLRQYMDIETVFPPGLRAFFWLTREDVVSQAYSFAVAKRTGRWHTFHEAGKIDSINQAVSDGEVWRQVLLVLSQEQSMQRFFDDKGLKPHRLTYEQLVADKYMTIMRVMDQLRRSGPQIEAYIEQIRDSTQQIQYSDKYAYLCGFMQRFRSQLEYIELERPRISLTELWSQLRDILQ